MGTFANTLDTQLDREWSDFASDKAYQRRKEMLRDGITDGTTKPRAASVVELQLDNGTYDELALSGDARKENRGPASGGIRWGRIFITAVILGGIVYLYKRWK